MEKNISWAEKECRLACKKENPDYDFDSEDFDYGCNCYKSALKAYNALMEDGHSGTSIGFTQKILNKLIDRQPLTPITDSDFDGIAKCDSDEYLKERGLKSLKQCPRMTSLFRYEDLGGNVTYHDTDRAYFVDIEDPSDTYSSWTGFLDEMFPITMPYSPSNKKYVIYAQTFLVDKRNGDFDTKGILYVITPSGERVDIGIYQTEKNGKMVDITKEEYDSLLEKRIDKLNEKIAGRLLWTLISNSSSDKEIERREALYKKYDEESKTKWFNELSELCKFYDNPDNYKYNVFGMNQAVCMHEIEKFKDVQQLVEISDYLKDILDLIENEQPL